MGWPEKFGNPKYGGIFGKKTGSMPPMTRYCAETYGALPPLAQLCWGRAEFNLCVHHYILCHVGHRLQFFGHIFGL